MKIEYDNKTSLTTNPLPRANKCTAEDLNEIKDVVNANADELNENTSNIEQIQQQITDLENLIQGTVLFEDEDGVGSGTNITLTETSANYSYLEIFYGRSSTENTLSSVKVENPNNKQFGMSIIYASSGTTIQLYGARIKINGTSLTWSGSTITTISNTSISSTSATDVLKVYKIIGYK